MLLYIDNYIRKLQKKMNINLFDPVHVSENKIIPTILININMLYKTYYNIAPCFQCK